MKKTSLSDKMMYCTCNKKDNERPIRVLKVDEDVKEAIKDILEFPAGNVEALKQKIRVRCGKELCSEEEE